MRILGDGIDQTSTITITGVTMFAFSQVPSVISTPLYTIYFFPGILSNISQPEDAAELTRCLFLSPMPSIPFSQRRRDRRPPDGAARGYPPDPRPARDSGPRATTEASRPPWPREPGPRAPRRDPDQGARAAGARRAHEPWVGSLPTGCEPALPMRSRPKLTR